jgi:hypothetical protein
VETVKSKEQFFQPDPRSQSLGPPLENQYELLHYFGLHDGVPESVRSYMNSVVSLWLYGWLYYPFYPLAIFLSTVAVEMALQERFPEKRGRGLTKLLRAAKESGLLRDDGFQSLKQGRENTAMMDNQIGEIISKAPTPVPEESYVDVLVKNLPKVRNKFAHPEMHTIVPPGMTVDSLIVAAEIINQLWPAASQGTQERDAGG